MTRRLRADACRTLARRYAQMRPLLTLGQPVPKITSPGVCSLGRLPFRGHPVSTSRGPTDCSSAAAALCTTECRSADARASSSEPGGRRPGKSEEHMRGRQLQPLVRRRRTVAPLRISVEPPLEAPVRLRTNALVDCQTLLAGIPEYDAGALR